MSEQQEKSEEGEIYYIALYISKYFSDVNEGVQRHQDCSYKKGKQSEHLHPPKMNFKRCITNSVVLFIVITP